MALLSKQENIALFCKTCYLTSTASYHPIYTSHVQFNSSVEELLYKNSKILSLFHHEYNKDPRQDVILP